MSQESATTVSKPFRIDNLTDSSPCTFDWKEIPLALQAVRVLTDLPHKEFSMFGFGSVKDDGIRTSYTVSLVQWGQMRQGDERASPNFVSPTLVVPLAGFAGDKGWVFEYSPKLVVPNGALFGGIYSFDESNQYGVFVIPFQSNTTSHTVVYFQEMNSPVPPGADFFGLLKVNWVGTFAEFTGKAE